MNTLNKLLVLILAVCAIFKFYVLKDENNDITFKPKNEEQKREVSLKEINENITLDYNYPDSLSGKTKDEVYTLRKYYVDKSIFSIKNYKPSEEVFGQIEDNKPWISLNICKDGYGKTRTYGPSEEARYISNPSILISIEYPFLFSNYPSEDWCNSSINQIIPKKVSYDGPSKTITVVYNKLPFKNYENDFYNFNGVNARDLGYKYAYLDRSKSSLNFNFLSQDNISNEAVEFVNFIHLGSSCGIEGGCNNGSPRQSYLEFKQHDTDYFNTNGVLYFKLWKNKPISVFSEPDIVEKIILERY